jgi:hypothetical protein
MHTSQKTDQAELCDTLRLECFSDGAFAMIKTLLLLEIHCPNAAQGTLARELLDEWPLILHMRFPSLRRCHLAQSSLPFKSPYKN